MTDPIIEAAARALCDSNTYEELLAAVTPLIEASALERAAKVADEARALCLALIENIEPSSTVHFMKKQSAFTAECIAVDIRALIPKDSGGTLKP